MSEVKCLRCGHKNCSFLCDVCTGKCTYPAHVNEVKCSKCGHSDVSEMGNCLYLSSSVECHCVCTFTTTSEDEKLYDTFTELAMKQRNEDAGQGECPECHHDDQSAGKHMGTADASYRTLTYGCNEQNPDANSYCHCKNEFHFQTSDSSKTETAPCRSENAAVKDSSVSADQVDTALTYCTSGEGRSIGAQESKLSAICRTNDCQWLSVQDFPPPDRHLILLHGPLGKYGIGFFENGVQREQENAADWKAGYWMTLPCGPNTMNPNFIDRHAQPAKSSEASYGPDRGLDSSASQPLSAAGIRAGSEAESFANDDGILIHRAEFLVCDPCVKLEGEECHTPECVFCFQPVSVARTVLDKTLNCPIIDGRRLILLGAESSTPAESGEGGTVVRVDYNKDPWREDVCTIVQTASSPSPDLSRLAREAATQWFAKTLAYAEDARNWQNYPESLRKSAIDSLADEVQKLATVITQVFTDYRADEWLPIETAPRKNGEHILVFVPYNQCALAVYTRPNERHWYIAGAGDRELPGHWIPTHWMPLPAPPADKASGEVGKVHAGETTELERQES